MVDIDGSRMASQAREHPGAMRSDGRPRPNRSGKASAVPAAIELCERCGQPVGHRGQRTGFRNHQCGHVRSEPRSPSRPPAASGSGRTGRRPQDRGKRGSEPQPTTVVLCEARVARRRHRLGRREALTGRGDPGRESRTIAGPVSAAGGGRSSRGSWRRRRPAAPIEGCRDRQAGRFDTP